MHARHTDVPDDLWHVVSPLFRKPAKNSRGGRPRVPDRVILAGVIYKLRTGCQWKALPADFSSGSTVHRRFSEWVASGLFDRMYRRLLRYYDQRIGIDWDWTALDSVIVKAPKGGRSPAETRQTGARAARNATSSPMPRASRSASCSAEPTCPICGWH